MDPERYLARIGLDPEDARPADRETLARLQAAHVATVPFETLSVTGDPFGPDDGEEISLALPALYDKVVERRRGGWCFELDGLFGWLLDELGFDVTRIAARVLVDGDPRPPANHHPLLVTLDRPYVVDVGLGSPKMRRPVPLDGSVVTDAAGVAWRIVESDRPDADYLARCRGPGEDGDDGEWSDRYVFDTTPRDLSYFAATCEYLATAPESPFTGDPVVILGTDDGHKRLTPDALSHVGAETDERPVSPDEWHDVLAREFGLRYPGPGADRESAGDEQ